MSKSSCNIADCCQELQNAWPLLRNNFCKRFPGWGIELTCTYRPPEQQFELFKKGRVEINGEWVVQDAKVVVTYIDGIKKPSEHNKKPARAFDVMIKKPDGKITWDLMEEPWKQLPEIVASLGLESGGNWKRFKDFPHVQMSRAGWV